MIEKFGDWDKMRDIVYGFADRFDRNIEKVMKVTAERVAEVMQAGIKQNRFGFVPNKEATQKRKGSSLPLVDTGSMVDSIQGIAKGKEAFVGITRSAKRRESKPGEPELVNLAAIQFFGCEKVGIPKRDPIAPTLKGYKKTFIRDLEDAVQATCDNRNWKPREAIKA